MGNVPRFFKAADNSSESDAKCQCATDTSTDSPIYAVPNDLIPTILQHLSAADLCHVASCCRWLRILANQDSLWRPLCQSRGWEHYGTTTDLAKIASYGPSKQATGATKSSHYSVTFQNDGIVTDDNTAGLTSTCRWKGVYMRAYHLDRNWSTNHSQECKIKFNFYSSPAFFVDGDLLAIHNCFNEIRVYDIRKKTHLCVIPCENSANSIKLKDGVLVVPFREGRAHAFEARTGKKLQTIKGNWVYGQMLLFFDGEVVIIIPRDDEYLRDYGERLQDIYVWSVKDGKPQCILIVDPADGVNKFYGVDYRDKMVAAVYDDDYIRVWDTRSGQCLHKLKCPGEMSNVQLGDNVIVGLSTEGNTHIISIWSQDTGECEKVIHVDQPNAYIAGIVNNLIILQCSTKYGKRWTRSMYAFNLRGELVTKEMRRTLVEVNGNGSKVLFHLHNDPVEGSRETWKGVIFNATPNGLVRLFDVGSAKILWMDEIRMILYDDDKHRILIHNYW